MSVKQRRSYFLNDKGYFQKIPQHRRKKWLTRMYRAKQIKQEPPKVFLATHDQSKNPFSYKQWTLNYHKIEKQTDPKTVLFWFHGLNGHGGNYAYITTNIARQLDINIYLLDLLNFGQSQGPHRGLIESFQQCLDQAEKFIVFILSKYKKIPRVFLGGDSFGGTMCFNLSLLRPNYFAGIIFLVPGLRDLPNLKLAKQATRIVGYFLPKIGIITGHYDMVTKYNCQRLVKQDKHNYLEKLLTGTYRVVLNAVEETSKKFQQFSAPYICFQGGVDKIVDPFGPLDLQRQCKSPDKKTIYFKNMWHNVSMEQQVEHVTVIIIEWLRQRIQPSQ